MIDDSCRRCGLHGGDCWPHCPDRHCEFCDAHWFSDTCGDDCPNCHGELIATLKRGFMPSPIIQRVIEILEGLDE